MVLYRRNRVAGGTYFFTVTLRDRSSDILVRHVRLLRGTFLAVRMERPFTIDRHRYLAGSLACHLDFAGWRRGLFRALAGNQIPLHARTARLWDIVDLRRSWRISIMATPILGAYNTG
jgi:hypothetical protein